MGLDLWFREDVARILTGLARQASRQEGSDHRQGYLDALGDVAASFGLPTVQVERPALGDGNGRGQVIVYDIHERS